MILLLLIFLPIFLPTVFSCYTSSRFVDSETHVIFLCQLNGIIRDEYSYRIDLYHIYVEICSILFLASSPSISSGAGNRCKMGPLYLPHSWRSIFSVSNMNIMPYNIHASFAKVSFKNWQSYTSHLIFLSLEIFLCQLIVIMFSHIHRFCKKPIWIITGIAAS